MTAWMVLTRREPYQRAVRAGQAGARLAWKPESIPSPKLADPDIVCFVIMRDHRPQLVAVLHDPEYVGKGFRGHTNETPWDDLTGKWFKLKFADGAGNRDPASAASALKQPRALAASDLKLLGIGATASPSPEVPLLACVATVRDPKLEALDASQRKQVEAAGRGYDGQKLSAAQRLKPSKLDDGSFSGSLVIRRFEGQKRGTRYDVFTYKGDSGCVFRAGTTQYVARIIQGSLQCDDPDLAALLEESMKAARPAPARVKAKRAKPNKKASSSSTRPVKKRKP